MQRGALLLKALKGISFSIHFLAIKHKSNRVTQHNHLHLVASLVEVDRVLTNNGGHFLLFSTHDSG